MTWWTFPGHKLWEKERESPLEAPLRKKARNEIII
jgi:hypothetical protein